jgi:hypothetical protein
LEEYQIDAPLTVAQAYCPDADMVMADHAKELVFAVVHVCP